MTEVSLKTFKIHTDNSITSLHNFLSLTITMSDQIKHWHVTYNDIHNLIRKSTPNIVRQFNPDLLIAIGGGYVAPA